MSFSDNKAGMSGIDKEHIKRIIEQNTGANFNSHALKQKERIEEQARRNTELLSSLTEDDLETAEQEMDVLVKRLEAERDLSRVKVHVDIDAFYAAVEMRDAPELRNVPMAVGGDSMLGTSNYAARRFGIRSAMPGFIARKLCPSLVIVPGRHDVYRSESSVFKRVLKRYDPKVRMGGLDEASLDLTQLLADRTAPVRLRRVRYSSTDGCCVCRLPLLPPEDEPMPPNAQAEESQCAKCKKTRKAVIDSAEFGTDVEEVVREIRFCVEQETGLTCSAGIAANSLLAKIGSDFNKPNGQFHLPSQREAIIEFMRVLPIRKVSGIGPVSEALLQRLGIQTCGHIYKKKGILKLVFSEGNAEWFVRIALGISYTGDYETDEHCRSRKSISVEKTFQPKSDIATLKGILRRLCDELIDSLTESNIDGGRNASLKIKFATFDVVTRAHTMEFLIQTASTLYPVIERLLLKELKERGKGTMIRLLGIRLSHLQLIGENGPKRESVQSSLMDFVTRRPKKRPSKEAGPKRMALQPGIEVIDLVSSSDEDEGRVVE